MNPYHFNKKGTETTVLRISGDVPVIQFKSFRDLPWLTHGFSTRMGGVSAPPFDSMNLSFTRGDDEADVMENFKRFGKAVGVLTSQMVFSDQTHTANVGIVTEEDLGKGILKPKDYTDIDGLVTNCPGACLVTFFADCVPLFFADPVKKVIGLSHSGWRGTAAAIGHETIEMMRHQFGCRPEDIIAAVGPSICGSCYEVSEDVAQVFRQQFRPEETDTFLTEKGGGKYLLDLWQANACILLNSGILPEHLAVTDLCTCCNSDLLWSHRKTGGVRGSLAAFLMIRE
ncbi:MAG TPA: peptidoglycan editing factor PgeF [Candidatus Scybalocola faecipullorum]|nr:peptidoglycan editing factor PgeF [Candidatus Scybalocola faecipullorum]